jgi:hypothetical protein
LKYTIWCPGCCVTESIDKLPPLHMFVLIFHEDYKLWNASQNFLLILAIFLAAWYFYFYSLPPPFPPPPLPPTYSSMARQLHRVVPLELSSPNIPVLCYVFRQQHGDSKIMSSRVTRVLHKPDNREQIFQKQMAVLSWKSLRRRSNHLIYRPVGIVATGKKISIGRAKRKLRQLKTGACWLNDCNLRCSIVLS